MSEETIKMLNMINNEIKKCIEDNKVDTLLAIPLGGHGEFGYLTDKMLNEILQIQQENQQLMINNKRLSRVAENRFDNILMLEKQRDLYKSVIDEINKFVKENKNRCICQDGMGADWYYEDLTVYDELVEILDKANIKEKQVIDNNTMVSVGARNFKCECGANVFTQYDDGTFKCHGCENEYKGE